MKRLNPADTLFINTAEKKEMPCSNFLEIRGGGFSMDGVHPGYTGHALIANFILEGINEGSGHAAPLHRCMTCPRLCSMIPIVTETETAGPQARHMKEPVLRNFFSCLNIRTIQIQRLNQFCPLMSGKEPRISF